MRSNRKLDEAVAEHILGWRNEAGKWLDGESGAEVELRPFSIDLTAAWMLAERICDRGFRLQMDGARLWQARFYKSAAHTLEMRDYIGTSREPAEAICKAALAVKGVKA